MNGKPEEKNPWMGLGVTEGSQKRADVDRTGQLGALPALWWPETAIAEEQLLAVAAEEQEEEPTAERRGTECLPVATALPSSPTPEKLKRFPATSVGRRKQKQKKAHRTVHPFRRRCKMSY